MLHLHTSELGPSIDLCYVIHLNELPSANVGSSKVANFSSLDEIVESQHRLFHWGLRIKLVNHQNVDKGSTQSLQRVFNLVEYCRARKTAVVDIVAIVFEFWTEEASNGGWLFVIDKEANLCDDNEVVPWNIVLITISIVVIMGMVIGRRLTCLINLPMMDSDSPLLSNVVKIGIQYVARHTHLYMLAVSQVVTPMSHAAFRSGNACGTRHIRFIFVTGHAKTCLGLRNRPWLQELTN